MNTFFRLLLVLFVALSAVLVFVIVRQSRARFDFLPSEVGADSIEVYARRADSLERVSEVLEMDLNAMRLLDQPSARLRLVRLHEEIESLRTAVERWQVARTPAARDNAYRECILLYGRASGICEALQADVPAEGREDRNRER